jgi:hypothetical protein
VSAEVIIKPDYIVFAQISTGLYFDYLKWSGLAVFQPVFLTQWNIG